MKVVVVVLTVAICLVVGEIALRYFTVFPISRDSNRIRDPRLGYKLSPKLADADSFGFRNREGLRDAYEVAAIGDSHTYGYNVRSEDSWPAVFGRLTGLDTYNFGIPGYDMFSYHVLIDQAIDDGAKGIVVALYPSNDLSGQWIVCASGGDFDYWQGQVVKLQLDVPKSKSDCAQHRRRERKPKSLDKYISNSAIFSAIDYLLLKKITVYSRRSKFMANVTVFIYDIGYTLGFSESGDAEKMYRFPGNMRPIPSERMQIVRKSELGQLENFKKLASEWTRRTSEKGIKFGMVIIPSRSEVIYEYMNEQDILDAADPEFRKAVEVQIAFDRSIEKILDELAIPYEKAVYHNAIAYGKSTEADENFFPAMDSHPLEAGTAAYAVTAAKLWKRVAE